VKYLSSYTYLSNGEDFVDMVLFGKTHKTFLQEYILLANGIPSEDTFERVFSAVEPDVLRVCLNDYGKDVVGLLSEKQICLDGKKLKGVSPTTRGNRGLHILNAWVAENRICIGQKRVEDKSNEITAIPALIEQIDVKDAVVSIDAIGCQRDIAEQIVKKEGHYLLALKTNQRELYDDVECGFKACKPISMSETWEYDHGRYETRKCSILSSEEVLLPENQSQWCGLKTIIKVEAMRMIKGKETSETRFYISDEQGKSTEYYNALVRGHWSIENQLHWHLDVTFKEDDSRARKGNAPENLSTFRKLALQIIAAQNDKLSLKKRRVRAAYDQEYMKKLLK
jgi:predicted transposase YbfD/YdcC